MSYTQAVKWSHKHPKGTHQDVILHVNSSGFWPSGAFLKGDYWPYLRACKRAGVEPVGCETFYQSTLRGAIRIKHPTKIQKQRTQL